MKSGVYSGISNADYHGGPGLSVSVLKAMQRSPLHCWAEYLDPDRPPREETKALQLGTAIHAAVLEPDVFAARYVVAPQVDRRTKDGKTRWEEFVSSQPADAVVLSADDFDTVQAVAGQVRQNPMAQVLLSSGEAEQSVYWEDAETGVLCRCRPDWLSRSVCVDVKSTDDASPSAFQRSIMKFGYHIQAAWYLDGLRAVGEKRGAFVFMAVEKSRPHAVGLYYADDDMLAVGRKEYRRLLAQYAECKRTGVWPGYGSTIEPISLPLWMLAKAANDNDE